MYALSVKGLKKVYANGLIALKGIDLNVAEGDFFALLGPNGAGKSTTIGILSSLVNKTAGEVNIFEYNMDIDPEGAKACLGVVPQEINFNPFEKVIQIVANQAGYYGIPRKIAFERADYYLEKMGLWEKRHHSALRLSGGMKRRLMIVRALVNQPRLLILDEPSAGVDIELRYGLWEFLKELNQQGTTIILTTHYLEEAEQLCKNIAIIDRGEIIKHANTKSLLNHVHVQTLILNLSDEVDSSLDLGGFQYRILDPTSIEVELQHEQSLNALFGVLTEKQLRVLSMRNKTNRLEELFIRLITDNKSKQV